MIAYKLLRVRKDGTLGPLFVERTRVLPVGGYLEARMDIEPKALATRPGWHCTSKPEAPHLKTDPKNEDRQWWKVEIPDVGCEDGRVWTQEIHRPEAQGGLWFLTSYMKLIEPVNLNKEE